MALASPVQAHVSCDFQGLLTWRHGTSNPRESSACKRGCKQSVQCSKRSLGRDHSPARNPRPLAVLLSRPNGVSQSARAVRTERDPAEAPAVAPHRGELPGAAAAPSMGPGASSPFLPAALAPEPPRSPAELVAGAAARLQGALGELEQGLAVLAEAEAQRERAKKAEWVDRMHGSVWWRRLRDLEEEVQDNFASARYWHERAVQDSAYEAPSSWAKQAEACGTLSAVQRMQALLREERAVAEFLMEADLHQQQVLHHQQPLSDVAALEEAVLPRVEAARNHQDRARLELQLVEMELAKCTRALTQHT